jgi:IS30 family transposase
MSRYTRLSLAEREEISRHVAAGASLRTIAHALERSPSTISRELRRTGNRRLRTRRRRYRAAAVHAEAAAAAQAPRRPRTLAVHQRLWAVVQARLAQRWSPEQIARWLRTAYPDDATMRISHEAIYTYLYVLPRGELKATLLRCLRQRRKHRKRRGTTHDRRGQIPDMLSIEERPAEVADRTVPGHWEGDLLMGRRHASALGTLVERTTRFTLLVPLRGQDPTTVRRAFARELRTLPAQVRRSLTYDRGREMLEHRLFTRDTQVQVYFAHPHSPWERGTNENTNGLIRQFFPKGTDFSQVARCEVKHVQALLNGRPRKVLNWRFPCEAMRDHLVALET